jgi:hypothetical protein
VVVVVVVANLIFLLSSLIRERIAQLGASL